MNLSTTTTRSTKYCRAVENIVKAHGHATNQQIHAALRQLYPNVSLTTVHRITTRLYLRGLIAQAPSTTDGSLRYDANTSEHDHFVCSYCGGVRDIDIAGKATSLVESALGGCKLSGRLVVNGTCEQCHNIKGVKV